MKKIGNLLSWFFILFITACSSTRNASFSPTETHQGSIAEFEGMIDLGVYKMYLHCMGSGIPTVIMEAGYNDISETWSLVQPKVAAFSRVCAYDRIGLGKSDPSHESRDSYQIVRDLYVLLTKAGISGPYVLVGHSLGGMYMRLFADLYQEEVDGLVLVDSAHIDDAEHCSAVLPPETPNESESLRSIREYLANPLTFPEIPDKIFEPGSLGDIPLVVLSVPKQQRAEDLPAGFRDAMDQIWVDLQEEWALISTRSTHILVYESSHFIQKDQPDQVINAILQVIDEARREYK